VALDDLASGSVFTKLKYASLGLIRWIAVQIARWPQVTASVAGRVPWNSTVAVCVAVIRRA
jgi:hypothetical protein